MALKTTKQIKQEIRQRLLNEDEMLKAIAKTRDILDSDKNKLAEDNARKYKEELEKLKEDKNEISLTCEYYNALLELAKIETWHKYYDIALTWYNTVIYNSEEKDQKLTTQETYKKYVAFITDAKEYKRKTATAKRIFKDELDGILSLLVNITDTAIIRYTADIEISKDDALEIFKTSNGIINGDGSITLNGKEHLKAYTQAVTDIKNNEHILLDILSEQTIDRLEEPADTSREEKPQDEQLLSGEDKTDINKELYNIIPAKILNYPDIFTIADTEMLDVLTTAKYNVDLSIFKKSDETLKSLSHQDREILDYIVLTLYPNNQTVFSDYQIATGLYKEQTSKTVSDVMLKEINDSINRIRNVLIDEGFISSEKIGDLKAEVKINDHLITLRQIDVKHENKTTWYRIIGDPFYYDYAIRTKKISHYKKQLITRDIKNEHIQHNIKNDTLKMMLARRVISLNYYDNTTINILEIYDILGLKDNRDYTKARNKAEEMLKDLQKDYNFKYAFKKKTGTRTVNRLILEKYNDGRPLEKAKKF